MEQGMIADAPENIKACADCVHLLGVRYRCDEAHQHWRCVHPNNDNGIVQDIVTGLRYRVVKIVDIYSVRLSACKGDWFEKYEAPNRTVPTLSGLEATELTFDSSALEEGKKAAQERLAAIRAKRAGPKLSASDLDNL